MMLSAAKFSPAEDEELIKIVEVTPMLWNTNHPGYKKGDKLDVWADIGQRLTRRVRTAAECRSRWRSIRDYYKKQKRDEKGTKLVPAPKRRQVYWDSLKFLDEVEEDYPLSVVKVELTEDVGPLDQSRHRESVSGNVARPGVPAKKQKLDVELLDVTGSVKQEFRMKSVACTQPEVSPDTSYSSDKLGYNLKDKFKELNDRVAKNDVTENDIDLFFNAMAATVKRLPQKLQTVAKSRIFAVVNELEMGNLESPNQCPNLPEKSE